MKDLQELNATRTMLYKQDLVRIERALRIMRTDEWNRICNKLTSLPSWHEVESASFYFMFESVEIDVTLDGTIEDPQFVRDVVRHGLAHKMAKEQSYDGASLKVRGELADEEAPCGLVILEVHGYVPATCRVEYEEVAVPAQPASTKRVPRIICTDDSDVTPA